MYKLSILICSLPNRLHLLHKLCSEINSQSNSKSVQYLYLGDNKSMSVGEKRNHLINMAKGQYLTFIDDDDMIKKDYFSTILEAIDHNPQVICFQVEKFYNGDRDRIHRFSRAYGRNHRDADRAYNNYLPNHLCVWRKDLIKEKFPDKNLGEDHLWADLMTKHYDTELQINKILYVYQFDKSVTETQQR